MTPRSLTTLIGGVGLAVAVYLVFLDQPTQEFPGAGELGSMPGYGLLLGVGIAFVSVLLLVTTFGDPEPDPGDSFS